MSASRNKTPATTTTSTMSSSGKSSTQAMQQQFASAKEVMQTEVGNGVNMYMAKVYLGHFGRGPGSYTHNQRGFKKVILSLWRAENIEKDTLYIHYNRSTGVYEYKVQGEEWTLPAKPINRIPNLPLPTEREDHVLTLEQEPELVSQLVEITDRSINNRGEFIVDEKQIEDELKQEENQATALEIAESGIETFTKVFEQVGETITETLKENIKEHAAKVAESVTQAVESTATTSIPSMHFPLYDPTLHLRKQEQIHARDVKERTGRVYPLVIPIGINEVLASGDTNHDPSWTRDFTTDQNKQITYWSSHTIAHVISIASPAELSQNKGFKPNTPQTFVCFSEKDARKIATNMSCNFALHQLMSDKIILASFVEHLEKNPNTRKKIITTLDKIIKSFDVKHLSKDQEELINLKDSFDQFEKLSDKGTAKGKAAEALINYLQKDPHQSLYHNPLHLAVIQGLDGFFVTKKDQPDEKNYLAFHGQLLLLLAKVGPLSNCEELGSLLAAMNKINQSQKPDKTKVADLQEVVLRHYFSLVQFGDIKTNKVFEKVLNEFILENRFMNKSELETELKNKRPTELPYKDPKKEYSAKELQTYLDEYMKEIFRDKEQGKLEHDKSARIIAGERIYYAIDPEKMDAKDFLRVIYLEMNAMSLTKHGEHSLLKKGLEKFLIWADSSHGYEAPSDYSRIFMDEHVKSLLKFTHFHEASTTTKANVLSPSYVAPKVLKPLLKEVGELAYKLHFAKDRNDFMEIRTKMDSITKTLDTEIGKHKFRNKTLNQLVVLIDQINSDLVTKNLLTPSQEKLLLPGQAGTASTASTTSTLTVSEKQETKEKSEVKSGVTQSSSRDSGTESDKDIHLKERKKPIL